MAHRVLDDGLGTDDALREAEIAGLRTPAYAEKRLTISYAARKLQQPS
jgi:hypothetical protein